MKDFLNDAKVEYIEITNLNQKLENHIKTLEENAAENDEIILDLKDQLIEAHAYSSEQSKKIESLEKELEQLTKKLEAKETIKMTNKELEEKNEQVFCNCLFLYLLK